MQCSTCGSPLPTGAANCPNCGSAMPYNASAGSYDPTQRAGQVPPTSYGSPPPPPSMPSVDPSYPYGSTPYDRTTASSPYGTTYPTPQTPTPQMQGYPQQYNNVQSVPNYPQVPQTPRKNNSTIIIASVGVVLVLVIILGVLIVPHLNKSSQGTAGTQTAVVNNPTATPTQAPPATPTQASEQVDPAAAKIIVDARTASAYDKENFTPSNLTSTFKEGDTIYISYDLNLADVTPKNGVYGNVEVKFINDGILYQSGTLDNVDDEHIDSVTQGTIPAYFYLDNYPTTTSGVIKLYWCDTNDCTNPKLAQVETFTVS